MEIPPEDSKLVALARMSRARNAVSQGAAVRDLDGRSYSASTVSLRSLSLSALELAVAMAVSSGAKGLEAAAVVTEGDVPIDIDAITELSGSGINVVVADPDGIIDDIIVT